MNTKQRTELHEAVANYIEDTFNPEIISNWPYKYRINTKYWPLELWLDGMHYESQVFHLFWVFQASNPLTNKDSAKYNIFCMYTDPLEYSFERIVEHLSVTQ